MKRLQSSDKSIVVVGLLCAAGLLGAGQWAANRPPRVVVVPTPVPAIKVAPVATLAPTATPRPTLGALKIAVRQPGEDELAHKGADPERILEPVLTVHPWNRIESEQWSMVRCWRAKSDGKWELYKGANPPWAWCFGDGILRTQKMQPALLYAPIGRWKLDIQLQIVAQDTFNTVRKHADCTVVLDVSAKSRKWDPVPKVPLELGANGKPLPRTIWLQYLRDGKDWQDAPRPGEVGFPIFLAKDMLMSFRVVELIPNAPLGKNLKEVSSTFWRSPSFDDSGPGRICISFEDVPVRQLCPVSAMYDALQTYVCVLPPEYE